MRNIFLMCAANNILLISDCNHTIVWKMADRFPELLQSDLNVKKNLRQLLSLAITSFMIYQFLADQLIASVLGVVK